MSTNASESPNCLQRQESARFQKRMYVLAAGVIILVGTVYLLDKFSSVIQQLLIALFFIYLLMPPYHWLLKHQVSPALACLAMVVGIVVIFASLGVLIGSSIADMEEKLPRHEEALVRQAANLTAQIPVLGPELVEHLQKRGPVDVDQGVRMLQTVLHGVSDFLSQFFVVLVFLCFMLAERAGFQQRMARAFKPERLAQLQEFLERINASIRQYIVVKTLMSLLGGFLTWAVLFGFGVDYAIVWGVMAFLLNYIPYLGSILATVLPVLLSLVQFEDPWRTLGILVLLLLVQNAIGYLIEPRLAGRRLDLSPLVIIIALAFWGSLWGIVGMILAVPLVVVVKTILEETPTTRPMARMLANA